MSGQEIETQGPGLYLSVTSVFRLDEDPSTGLGLLADDGGGDLRLLDADRFVERFEARSQIAMAEASRFIAALECQIGHLEDLREPQSKYLVHETLLSNNIPNMPPAVHLAAAPGISNAFLLGANRWPTAGVSNPAVLLGALAHSVATQLTKLGKSPY
ncbi:hypothetical protein ACMYR2_2013 [Nitrobacter sp. TKz-YC01]